MAKPMKNTLTHDARRQLYLVYGSTFKIKMKRGLNSDF